MRTSGLYKKWNGDILKEVSPQRLHILWTRYENGENSSPVIRMGKLERKMSGEDQGPS